MDSVRTAEPRADDASTELYQRLDKTASFPYPLKWYIRRAAWDMVQATVIRFSFRRAHRWRRFWLRRFGATVPSNSGTKASTIIKHPWIFTMGEHSMLSERVEIYNLGPVSIGDHTVLSQDVYICAGTHDYRDETLPLIRPRVDIGKGVWICAGAFVGPGVAVGDNAIVGAKAVAMRDVPPRTIVSGNPAKVVKDRPVPGATNTRKTHTTSPGEGPTNGGESAA